MNQPSSPSDPPLNPIQPAPANTGGTNHPFDLEVDDFDLFAEELLHAGDPAVLPENSLSTLATFDGGTLSTWFCYGC